MILYELEVVWRRLTRKEAPINYCGIDLASEASAVCLLTDDGTMIREQTVLTEAAGFEQALVGQETVRCVVEASPLTEWVAQIFEELGHEAIIIDPR